MNRAKLFTENSAMARLRDILRDCSQQSPVPRSIFRFGFELTSHWLPGDFSARTYFPNDFYSEDDPFSLTDDQSIQIFGQWDKYANFSWINLQIPSIQLTELIYLSHPLDSPANLGELSSYSVGGYNYNQ